MVKSFHSFNPHTYMRCDFPVLLSRIANTIVSIHTPTWGVTEANAQKAVAEWFQSTHLHEVWHFMALNRRYDVGFNPHTYMRCDKTNATSMGVWKSFNPHTYMRCDTWLLSRCLNQKFQSTHLHEVWQVLNKRFLPNRKFQSTHLHEVWLRSRGFAALKDLFQSTHLHEVWPYAG